MIGTGSARRWASAACLLVSVPVMATAQSLGDAARREAERREKNRVSGVQTRSYTEEDLATARGWVSQPGTALYDEWLRTPMPANSGRSGEAAWRNRAAQLRASASQADARLKAAESEAAGVGPIGLRRQMLEQRGGGYGTWAADAEAARAQRKVEAARSSADQARKTLEALDDEARRKGALPGWVR